MVAGRGNAAGREAQLAAEAQLFENDPEARKCGRPHIVQREVEKVDVEAEDPDKVAQHVKHQ